MVEHDGKRQSSHSRQAKGWLLKVRAHYREITELWPLYKRLVAYIKPYRGRWIAGLVFNSLYGATAGGLIFALRYSLEYLERAQIQLSLRDEILAATIVPIYFTIRAILGYLSAYCTMWVGMRILFDLKTDLFSHLQKLSLDFHSHQKSGNLIYQVIQRTKNAQMSLTQLVSDIMQHPVTVVSVIGVLLYQDVVFTCVALAFVPISLIPAFILGFMARHKGRQEESISANTVSILQENLLGVRVVKSYARGEDEVKRFRNAGLREYNITIRNRKIVEMVGPSVEILASLGFGAALIYGMQVHMPTSKLVSLAGGLFMLYNPFKQLSKLYVTAQRITAMLEGLFAILDEKPSVINLPNAMKIESVQGRIELEDVSFSYVTYELAKEEDEFGVTKKKLRRKLEERSALHDVNLVFEPGKFYALVGPSGAGKSTIFSLLMRFYDPQKGTVKLDGQDIRTLDLDSLRRQIGLVSQETFLFHDSIRENILYGRPKASQESIEMAAQRAFADEFIRHLPKGYDTVVGDKGCRFSGGQQQRLSLARAFLKNAPILLLDEATSALDAESAAKVQEAINRFAIGRTVIAIAHRLSTIERADEIIVMNRGRVVARGKHEQLLSESPLYRRLNVLQFGGILEEKENLNFSTN